MLPDPLARPALQVTSASLLLRTELPDGTTVIRKRLRDTEQHRTDLLLRLENEAGVLRYLAGTAGVIRLLAVEHDPFTLILEFADGGSLAERLIATLAPAAATAIARDLVLAVMACHAKGVVHRDIKPSNILFVAGALRLADFGVAAWGVPRRSLPEGWEEGAVGTPPWAAPELATDATAMVAESVDLFGVAMTLAAILGRSTPAIAAGQHHEPGNRATLSEMLESVRPL